jgi:hypothetical protein
MKDASGLVVTAQNPMLPWFSRIGFVSLNVQLTDAAFGDVECYWRTESE